MLLTIQDFPHVHCAWVSDRVVRLVSSFIEKFKIHTRNSDDSFNDRYFVNTYSKNSSFGISGENSKFMNARRMKNWQQLFQKFCLF